MINNYILRYFVCYHIKGFELKGVKNEPTYVT
jgi:hypothetical protein